MLCFNALERFKSSRLSDPGHLSRMFTPASLPTSHTHALPETCATRSVITGLICQVSTEPKCISLSPFLRKISHILPGNPSQKYCIARVSRTLNIHTCLASFVQARHCRHHSGMLCLEINFHNKRLCAPKIDCIKRESNPRRVDGNDPGYHYPINA